MGKLGLVLSLSARGGVQGKAEQTGWQDRHQKVALSGLSWSFTRAPDPFQGRLGTGNARGLQGLSLHLPAQGSGVLFWGCMLTA